MDRSILPIFLSIFLLAVVNGVQYDSPWTIKLTPSNDYTGPVEITAIFENGKLHAFLLPLNRYEKGTTGVFNVGLVQSGPLQMVYIRTHGQCPIGLLPLNVLRLRHIQLDSHHTNTTYSKFVNDLAVKDACQSNRSLGTALTDFEEYSPSYCVVQGKRHKTEEYFEMGCEAKCVCTDGSLGCVDMCPVMGWVDDKRCQYIHQPGECCDTVACRDDPDMNNCTAPVTAKGNRAPVRRYPWAVLICVNSTCSNVFGGVIIGRSHILTYAHDVGSSRDTFYVMAGQYIAGGPNSTRVSMRRVVSASAHPEFININSPIADSASRLQVLRVNEPFSYNKEVQAVNLPFNWNHSSQLSSEQCPLMTVGWDRTDPDDSVRQWFLHADQSHFNQTARHSSNSTGRIHFRGDKRVCLAGLIRKDCTGPIGGATLASAGPVDFLVGLLDPDASLLPCVDQGTASVLPIGKYLDWIATAVNPGPH